MTMFIATDVMKWCNSMNKAVESLDLKGLKCPLPVLKARKALKSLSAGDQIKLETTDPLAVIDIPAFCNENGHQLIKSGEFDGGNTFLIEKGHD